MRSRLLSPILLLSIAGFVSAQSSIDVLHYRYKVDVNDDNDSLYGVAVIRFLPGDTLSTVSFDLTGVQKNKGMDVTRAFFADAENNSTFMHQNDLLTIRSGKIFTKTDTASVIIYYKGIPADGLIISNNKFGRRTFFADNWPNRGHNWLPCHDVPGDKATVEFIVTAPDHYQVVANGLLIEETNQPGKKKLSHWKEDVPISTKVMVIGVADFAVQLSGFVNGCIPVYSWVYPENRSNGVYDYELAMQALPFFINRVGPYAYKKLANVQSKTTFGGLENANTIFYSETSVTGNRKIESTIAHEIAHQWFGNMATEKTFAHLWLSEGFATYMTVLYMENKYGKDTARLMLKEDREQVIQFARKNDGPVVDETTDYMQLLNANSYQKGGWILHMLHRQLGDSIFWKSIRNYYATYGGKTADTRDLQKIFEKESKTDLKQFFDQWLYRGGIPVVSVKWKWLAAEKAVELVVEQQQSALFAFPIEFSVGGELKQFKITGKTSSFKVPMKNKPATVIPDPNMSLLASMETLAQ